jgi:integrase/recombinase XerD
MAKRPIKEVESLIPAKPKDGPKVEKKEKDEKSQAERKSEPFPEIHDFEIFMLSNKRSLKTIKEYKLFIAQMLIWVDKPARKVTAADLERYKTHMSIEKNYSKNSMYIHIKAIQAFYSFLEMDIAEKIVPPKRAASLPKYLSEEEMAKLFAAARSDPVNGIRDYALLAVLGFTGLRVSELCHLNVEDIDFSEKTIKVRSGKGDKDRIVIFEEETEEALKNHLTYKDRHISKSDPAAVFVSAIKERMIPHTVEEIVKRYAQKAGIPKRVTPHVLRHTMATTLLKHGADIRIIQQLLGHSSIATTQIYTHVDEEMLKRAYSKSKPEYK